MAVVTSRTEAELIADVLRNNDLRAVVSAEMPATGATAAAWQLLDAANRQGAAVENTHPATAGRGRCERHQL